MIPHNWHAEPLSPEERGEDRALRREHLAWAAGGVLMLLLLASVAIVVAMLSPSAHLVNLADSGLAERARADSPIYIDRSAAGERSFFLVRTKDGILALSELPAHPHTLPVIWDPPSQLFIDPALGCSFKTDGSYVRGPCRRDLDRYPVTLRDGHVLVATTHPIQWRHHG